jgi:TraY domain
MYCQRPQSLTSNLCTDKSIFMPKRVGRPIKEPDPGERAALSLRVRPLIKKKLEESAEINGRSLSQEAEFRLEHTFDRQGLLREVMTLAFGKEWGPFLVYWGTWLKRFNPETSERVRNIIEKAVLSHDEDKNYREREPVQPGGRKLRREVAEVAEFFKGFGFDVSPGSGAYESPRKKRKGRR